MAASASETTKAPPIQNPVREVLMSRAILSRNALQDFRIRCLRGVEGAQASQHVHGGSERELIEQPAQAALTALEVGVVPEPRERLNLHPGLPGIDFPGMQIEREGNSGARVDLTQPRACQPVGQDAKVTSSRHWN